MPRLTPFPHKRSEGGDCPGGVRGDTLLFDFAKWEVEMKILRMLSAAAVVTVLGYGQQGTGRPADRPPVLTPQFWINVFPLGVRVYDIQPDARNTNVLYACTHRGLFKTSNGGMTWAPIFGYDVDCLAFAQSKTAPNVMYVGIAASRKGSVFKSVDSGNAWQPVGAEDIQRSIDSLQVDPASPDIVYVASGSNLFKTANGGRTWADVSPHASSPILPQAPNLGLVVVDPKKPGHLLADYAKADSARDGYCADCSNAWESKDGGLSWQHKKSWVVSTTGHQIATNWSAFFYHPTDDRVIAGLAKGDTWGGGHPAIIFMSRDGGTSWSDAGIREVAGPREWAEVQSVAWSPDTPGMLFAGSSQALYVSTDYGQNWTRILPYRTDGIVVLGKDVYAVTSAGLKYERSTLAFCRTRAAHRHWR